MSNSFEKLAQDGRTGLVLNWLYIADKKLNLTASECAAELTKYAVKSGLVPPRAAMTGATLSESAKAGKVSLWVSRAALSLLLENGWTPDDDARKAALASLLVRESGSLDMTDVKKKLPAYIDHIDMEKWILLAIQDRKAFLETKAK